VRAEGKEGELIGVGMNSKRLWRGDTNLKTKEV
jgi:hypothetical protein